MMRSKDLFGILGIGVLAIFCCAVLPALVAIAAGVGIAALLGGGVALAVAAGVLAASVMRMRRRDRRRSPQ